MKKRSTVNKKQAAAARAKRFVALARVSSREQEREGFQPGSAGRRRSRRYAERAGGQIAKLFRIAETASKGDERKTFRELIAYAKEECGRA